MKHVVCINVSNPGRCEITTVKGEIYTFNEWFDLKYFFLKEMGNDYVFLCTDFRPVDDSFGEVVTQTIIEQVQYEEAVA